MTEKKLRIANSFITIGKKYVLDHKPDPSAPNGMREMTKYPFEGNKVSEKIFFDEKRRQFDTCFYNESPSLRAIVTSETERAELVKAIEYYNLALEINPKNPLALYLRGHIYLQNAMAIEG
jgi:tetratricopeptide (TPR) repeat protein